MTLNRRFLPLLLTCLLVLLACAGINLPPTDAPAPPSATVALPTPTLAPLPATITPFPGPPMPENTQAAVVKHVVDGDTVELADGRKVRYIGINTPERGQPFYAEATEINRQLVENKPVQLEFDLETFDRYGRTLAYVWSNGVQVNYQMIRQGYANAFTVQPNVRYDQLFRQMEREAREAGRGLWAGNGGSLKIIQIQADAPGKDNENPNGEWIEITNQGQESVSMRGYTLKDQANHIYTFGNFTVPPGAVFRLFSGQGQSTPTQLYWGYVNDSVWNNDTDTAFLRDAQGALADVFSY